MGNDYTARKLSKKKRKREGVEAGPNAAEGGSKKRRSKTRRLCRGVCYQEPLLTAEDRIWEAGSDGEDGNFDPQQGWAPDTPPRTPLPGPPGGIFGALGRLGLLQAGPERQGATAGSKVRPRDGSEGRVPEAEDGAAEQSTKHKKNRKKRAGKDKQQQQQQQQTEADAGGSETAGAAHKPQRKQRLSTAVDLIMPEDDKAPASKPSRAERETAVAGPALARFPEPIQRFMLSEGFTEPTDIQERCWPACMAGRDVQAVAEPGSGKTLGYLLPVLPRLLAEGQGVASRPDGPLVLIMAPTRELAQQIATTARLLRKLFGLRTACIFGGADRAVQIEALGKQPHLVVATPGRLLDFVDENILHLGNVEVVVLDEADKMLSLGLQPQLDRLHDALLPSKKAKAVAAATAAATAATITSEDGPARLQHPAKRPQVLLFTATMPESLDEVSARWLRKPEAIRVTSSSASISSTVVQVVHVCAEHKKPAKLQKHLQQIREKGKQLRNPPRVLIFANRVKTVRFLHKLLADDGCRVVMLHGERSQHEREEAMRDFRSGKAQILVATDVAARGLHIRNLPYVVNYDFPSQLDSYIHRVGRTGRVAMNGHAFSFLTRQMAPIARALLNLLQDHNQSIDPNLIKLAEAYELAAQKLGTTAAAAPAQSGSDADEEEEHVTNIDNAAFDEEEARINAALERIKASAEDQAAPSGQQHDAGAGSEEDAGAEHAQRAAAAAGQGAAQRAKAQCDAGQGSQGVQGGQRHKQKRKQERKGGSGGSGKPGAEPTSQLQQSEAALHARRPKAQKPGQQTQASAATTQAHAAPPAPAESAPAAQFIKAARFTGAKAGFAFKRGAQGVGYYLDGQASSQKKGAGIQHQLQNPVQKPALSLFAAKLGVPVDRQAVKKRHAVPGRLRKKLAKERQQQRSTA